MSTQPGLRAGFVPANAAQSPLRRPGDGSAELSPGIMAFSASLQGHDPLSV